MLTLIARELELYFAAPNAIWEKILTMVFQRYLRASPLKERLQISLRQ